jgi:hypothetical protein
LYCVTINSVASLRNRADLFEFLPDGVYSCVR